MASSTQEHRKNLTMLLDIIIAIVVQDSWKQQFFTSPLAAFSTNAARQLMLQLS
jgi:hypothetical protein